MSVRLGNAPLMRILGYSFLVATVLAIMAQLWLMAVRGGRINVGLIVLTIVLLIVLTRGLDLMGRAPHEQ